MTPEEATAERDRLNVWVADVNKQAPQIVARIQYLDGFIAASAEAMVQEADRKAAAAANGKPARTRRPKVVK